ncbi:MAG: hypothetical protein AAF420_14125, partial [Pseudomonadota bacterium]
AALNTLDIGTSAVEPAVLLGNLVLNEHIRASNQAKNNTDCAAMLANEAPRPRYAEHNEPGHDGQ